MDDNDKMLQQIDCDIHEIECALDLFKRNKFVVWSSVHAAVGRLEKVAPKLRNDRDRT
jgi:hypothetical protein